MTVLHLGCGRKQYEAARLFEYVGLRHPSEGVEVMHLDGDASLKPDLVAELGAEPIPFADDSVDLIIIWHTLEHIGMQGDITEWFQFWEEAYRVLRPGGWIYGESPYYDSIWAWSDPTHARAISEHSFVFFSQDSYRVERSAISPYRIACDFQWLDLPGLPNGRTIIVDPSDPRNRMFRFALSARKPLAPWWMDARRELTHARD